MERSPAVANGDGGSGSSHTSSPGRAFVYAAGFDSSRNIFLGVSASRSLCDTASLFLFNFITPFNM